MASATELLDSFLSEGFDTPRDYSRQSNLGGILRNTPDEELARIESESIASEEALGRDSLASEISRAKSPVAKAALLEEQKRRQGGFVNASTAESDDDLFESLMVATKSPVSIEKERLRKINPGQSDSNLEYMAKQTLDNPAPTPITKQDDLRSRADRYKSKGSDADSAMRNAQFDQSLQDKLTALRANDGRNFISNRIDPLADKTKTKRDNAQLEQAREDVRISQESDEMNPFVRGIAKGFIQGGALTGGAAAYFGDLFGSEDTRKAGMQIYDRGMGVVRAMTKAKELENIESLDDAATWITENGGYVAYQAAESILAGGVGGIVGKTIGKEAAIAAGTLAANNLRQTLGSVYGDAVEESQRTGNPMPHMARIMAGAVASAAVDSVADVIGLKTLKGTTSGFSGSMPSRVAKSVGSQMAVQGGTEAAQLIPEDLGAGKDPFRSGWQSRFLNEGAVGALGGTGPGVLGGIYDKKNAPFQDFADAVEGTEFNPNATAREATLSQVSTIDPRLARITHAEQTKQAAQAAIATAPTVDAVVEAFQVANAAGSASVVDQSALLNELTGSTGLDESIATADADAKALQAGIRDIDQQPMTLGERVSESGIPMGVVNAPQISTAPTQADAERADHEDRIGKPALRERILAGKDPIYTINTQEGEYFAAASMRPVEGNASAHQVRLTLTDAEKKSAKQADADIELADSESERAEARSRMNAVLLSATHRAIGSPVQQAAPVPVSDGVADVAKPLPEVETVVPTFNQSAPVSKSIKTWTVDELQGRLDRAASGESPLSAASEKTIREELNSRPSVQQSHKPIGLSIGVSPNAAEAVSVRSGVVYVGDYPAMDYETEADITVPDGATPQQIVAALRKGGAIASSSKVFGLAKAEKSDPLPKVDRKQIDPAKDSLFVAIAKLGGMDTQELLSNGFDQNDITYEAAGRVSKEGVKSGNFTKNTGKLGKKKRMPRMLGFNMPLHRNGGISFDGMLEALKQHGYFPEGATKNDAIEAFTRELGGEQVLTPEAVEAEMEAAQAAHDAEMEASDGYDEQAAIEAENAAELRAINAGYDALSEDQQAFISGMRKGGLSDDEINGYIAEFKRVREGNDAGAETSQSDSGTRSSEESDLHGESLGGKEGQAPEWLSTKRSEFRLEGQTNEQASEQKKEPELTKEQIDRERDGTPFTLEQESQPKPMGVQADLGIWEPARSSYTDPYDNIETRPGSTERQLDTGRAALRSLSSLVGSRGANGSILGNAIYKGFVASGANQLIGRRAETTLDLAIVAQVYRDPRFETFRVIYLKNGEIVGEGGYTSRLPASVTLPRNLEFQISDNMAAFGADAYYVMHNHPSGEATPSRQDVVLTTRLAETVPGFAGHVVIDHNEFATISADGKVDVIPAPHLNGVDFSSKPEMAHAILGLKINSPDVAANVAKTLQVKDGYAAIVLTKRGGEIQFIADFPAAAIYNNGLQEITAAVRRISRATGSGGHRFLILPDGVSFSKKHWAIIREGIVTDIVSHTGGSLRNAGAPYGGDAIENNSRALKISEYGSTYDVPQSSLFARQITTDEKATVTNVADADLPATVKQTAAFLRVMARILGKKIQWVSGANFDGMVKDSDTIYLNVDGDTNKVAVFGHEFWHQVEMTHKAVFDAVLKVVDPMFNLKQATRMFNDYFNKNASEAEVSAWLKEKNEQGGNGVTNRDFLIREFLSDTTGNRFTESDFWGDVFAKLEQREGHLKAVTLIRRFVKSLTDALNKLTNVLKMQGFRTDNDLTVKQIGRVKSALSEGMAQYLQDTRYGTKANGTVASGAQNSTRRWNGVSSRGDYVVPSTPFYADNLDATDIATFDGLPVRITVGDHDLKYGVDHLYENGLANKSRDAQAIDGDKGEGHVRELLRVLKNANQKYPGAKQKITLRNGLALKAVVLEKRTDGDGNAFWSVITSVPASMNKVQGWGTPEKVKSPTILDPVAATSTEGYYTTLPDSLSQASVLGLPNSEWLDVSNPDGNRQEEPAPTEQKAAPTVTVKKRRNIEQYSPQRRFYSQLERTVEQTPDRIFATAPQFKMWLLANAGKFAIKKEEIQWTGITEWLDLQGKGKVSKADVLGYLAQNGVQVQEVEKGEGDWAVYDGEQNKYFTSRKEAEDYASNNGINITEDTVFRGTNRVGGYGTKYSNYVLPGATNYRELLLTLPEAKRKTADEMASSLFGQPFVELSDEDKNKVRRSINNEAKNYKSSHWDEPNILAHIRFNDRTDADGAKVLFVEEIQSDYAQDKRKGKDVPAAPFIDKTEAWAGLAIKRVIAYAVENGYDKVAFVNGQQSADRYDLSKQVKEIEYIKRGTRYEIAFTDINGNGHNPGEFAAEELEDVVGKEIAQKIINGDGKQYRGHEGRTLSDLDLKVGGEGMIAFYDKIIPQVVNDVLKKVGGGKVESVRFNDFESKDGASDDQLLADLGVEVEGARPAGQPGFNITDSMKAKVSEGMPLFSRRRTQSHPEDTKRGIDALNAALKDGEGIDTAFSFADGNDDLIRAFDKTFGVKVVAIKANNPNAANFLGLNFKGVLYVNAENPHAGFVQIAGHELLHQIARDIPSVYAAFEDQARTYLKDRAIESHTARLIAAGESASVDTYQEILADFVGDALADKAFLQTLAEANQSKFRMFISYVRRWLDNVMNKMRGAGLQSSQHFTDVSELREYLAAVLDIYSDSKTVPSSDGYLSRRAIPVSPPDETKARFDLPKFGKLDQWQERVQDRYNRIRDVVAAVRKSGLVNDTNDFSMGEDRFHGVAMNRMEQIGEDFESLITDMKAADVTLDEVTLYAYAEHAPERNAAMQRINKDVETGSGMSDQESSDIIDKAKTDGKDKALSNLSAKMRGIAERTLKLQLSSGLITQSEYDTLTNKYQKWVPLRGFETLDEDGKTFRGSGKGFNIRGKENLRALGRDSKAGQILENIILDAERAAIRGTKNTEVNHRFLRFVLDNPDATLWEIDRTKMQQAMKNGKVSLDSLIDKGDNTIGVKVNGEVAYVKIHDDKLFEQLANQWEDIETKAIPYLGEFQKYLSKSYTAWSPEFALYTNPVRDVQAALVSITGREGVGMTARFAKNFPKALAAAYRSEVLGKPDAWFDEYKAMGGRTGFWNTHTLQSKHDEIQALIKDMEGLKLRNAWRQPLKMAKALEKLISGHAGALENATRLASYMAMREAGRSKEQAAEFSKNLNVNFNRRGTWTPMLGSIFLFFNPAIQGTHNMYQTLTHGKHKEQAWALVGGGVLAMFALAMLNAGAGEDDDGVKWWDKIPDYEKERNIIVVIPSFMKTLGEQIENSTGRYIKFPMPYGWNTAFYSGVLAADVMRNADNPAEGTTAGKGALLLGKSFATSFSPVTGLPPQLAPFYQHAANKKPFGEGQLYPKHKWNEHKPDSEKYSGSMKGSPWQEWASFVNSATGGNKYQAGFVSIPPAVWRNYARSFLGGPMSFGTGVVDSISEGDITKAPFARKIYGEVGNVQDMAMYYRIADEAIKVRSGWKDAKKAGDRPTAEAIYQSNKALIELGGMAEDTNDRLGRLYKKDLSVKDDANLTDAEKKLKLKINEKQRSDIQEQFLKKWRQRLETGEQKKAA